MSATTNRKHQLPRYFDSIKNRHQLIGMLQNLDSSAPIEGGLQSLCGPTPTEMRLQPLVVTLEQKGDFNPLYWLDSTNKDPTYKGYDSLPKNHPTTLI